MIYLKRAKGYCAECDIYKKYGVYHDCGKYKCSRNTKLKVATPEEIEKYKAGKK